MLLKLVAEKNTTTFGDLPDFLMFCQRLMGSLNSTE